MATRSNLELTLTTRPRGEGDGEPEEQEQPLRFLVLGRLSDQVEGPASLQTHRVGFDNFDEVLGRVSRSVTSLEQFHPDFLAETRPELRELVELRQRLAAPATRAAALERLAALSGASQTLGTADAGGVAPAPEAHVDLASADENDSQLLSRLLGGSRPSDANGAQPSPADSRGGNGAAAAVDRLVQQVVEPAHLAPAAEPDANADEQLLQLLAERFRSALWAPGFRALERAWRSVHFLVSRFEADQGEVYVLDLSKAALAAHLAEHAHDLDTSPLVRLLAADEAGWDFIVADYTFELRAEDLMLIGNLGTLAARAGAPLLAHGDLGLAGCQAPDAVDTPTRWSFDDPKLAQLLSQVRAHPAAKWVGLAAPRFLLRHPYGKRSDPIDSFPFEELPERPTREHFLWGNPAFACAWIQGKAHAVGGARWPLRQASDVRDLPMPPYYDGTGEAMQPPLEVLLGESARALAEQHGLIVFSGSQHQNRILTSALHAFATP